MPFKIDCPHCNRVLNVTEKAYGKTLPCSGCNQPVAIPQPFNSIISQNPTQSNESPAHISQDKATAKAASTPPLKENMSQAASEVPQTRICEWCAESISIKALKCPRCTKWRKDIEEDRRDYITAIVSTILIGILLVAAVFISVSNKNELSEVWVFIILAVFSVPLVIGEFKIRRAKSNLKQKIGSDWKAILPDWLSFLSS
jgi:hypothetical protein